MEFKYGTEIYSDPIEDFRNKFYKKVEDDRLQKEHQLKRVQKNCFHKYTKFIQYNDKLNLAVRERCNHAKFTKV